MKTDRFLQMILIGIALWVVSVIARGGLIAGVQQVEDEGGTRFGQAWRAGRKRFWSLFGIGILAGLPSFLIMMASLAVLLAACSSPPAPTATAPEPQRRCQRSRRRHGPAADATPVARSIRRH